VFFLDERSDAARLLGAADKVKSVGVRLILIRYQPHGVSAWELRRPRQYRKVPLNSP
jgi:hypothetical protein